MTMNQNNSESLKRGKILCYVHKYTNCQKPQSQKCTYIFLIHGIFDSFNFFFLEKENYLHIEPEVCLSQIVLASLIIRPPDRQAASRLRSDENDFILQF